MSIESYIKSNNEIFFKKTKTSILGKLLAWESLYLNNDIKIINFNKSEMNIKLYLYYDGKFNKCELSILSLKLINNNFNDKLNFKGDSLFSYLEYLDNFLDKNNEIHEDFSFDNIEESIKKIDFEWDPYLYLNIKETNSFNIINLKKLALEFYKSHKFDCQNLNITSNHIIDIIIKELKDLDNKTNFNIIIDDNIFNFDILFHSFENEKLIDNLKEHNLKEIKLNISLDPNLYPYYPPKIGFKCKLFNNLEIQISKLDYFVPSNWNPTNTLLNMCNEIHKILNEHALISNKIDENFEIMESLINNIISNYNFETNYFDNIKINYNKINSNSSDNKFWNSGVGYGYNGRTEWNINEFIEDKKVKTTQNDKTLKLLLNEIISKKQTVEFNNYIKNSLLSLILIKLIENLNIVELENLNSLDTIYNILIEVYKYMEDSFLDKISLSLGGFIRELKSFINFNLDIEDSKKKLYNNLITFYDSIEKKIEENNDTNEYCSIMKELQFPSDDITFTKYYYKDHKDTKPLNKKCIIKLTKELSTYKNSLPINYDSSIFVRYDCNNLRNLKALIIGPKDTPYENGCFIFDIYIPNNYPNDPPLVNLQTTGNGTVRFNPNLYHTGKVCLSLLGTWSGRGGESWNKDNSTLLQVLVSIQSLILVENPYFNEPGYERIMHTEKGKYQNMDYNNKQKLNTLTWAINDNLINSSNEFNEVITNHFKLKKDDIIKTIKKWQNEIKSDNEVNKCINLLEKL